MLPGRARPAPDGHGPLPRCHTPDRAHAPTSHAPAPRPRHAACMSVVEPESQRLQAFAAPAAAPAAGIEGSGLTPAELQSAYRLGTNGAGQGQTVAIVDAYDDPTAESDMAFYRSSYGLPACPAASGCFRKVNQTGGTKYPPQPHAENGDWDLEISLDLDMVSAACPSCSILLVEANSNSLANLTTARTPPPRSAPPRSATAGLASTPANSRSTNPPSNIPASPSPRRAATGSSKTAGAKAGTVPATRPRRHT